MNGILFAAMVTVSAVVFFALYAMCKVSHNEGFKKGEKSRDSKIKEAKAEVTVTKKKRRYVGREDEPIPPSPRVIKEGGMPDYLKVKRRPNSAPFESTDKGAA